MTNRALVQPNATAVASDCRCKSTFAFRRVVPPGPSWRALHIANGGDKRVEHAWIVACTSHSAKIVEQAVGIGADEVFGPVHPDLPKIVGDSRPDVW